MQSPQLPSPPVLPPEIRELVHDDGDDSPSCGELGPEPPGEQHQEEEDRPEGRDGHPGHCLRVGNEC